MYGLAGRRRGAGGDRGRPPPDASSPQYAQRYARAQQRLGRRDQPGDPEEGGGEVGVVGGGGMEPGGDRQLNRALHTIVVIRETWHEPTRRYVARRIAEGKSEREIRRCLKRTVARGLFRLLTRTVLPTTGPGGHGAWCPATPR